MTLSRRGNTLFAMKGRAKPIFPMACYTLYTCAAVTLMVYVPDLRSQKEVKPLSFAVVMVGEIL